MQTFNDVSTTLHDYDDGSIVICREQEISDDFIASIRSQRIASAHMREREYQHVASVPAAVFDLWHAQGKDPWSMDAREIVRHLRKDGLDAFIATSKAV